MPHCPTLICLKPLMIVEASNRSSRPGDRWRQWQESGREGLHPAAELVPLENERQLAGATLRPAKRVFAGLPLHTGGKDLILGFLCR